MYCRLTVGLNGLSGQCNQCGTNNVQVHSDVDTGDEGQPLDWQWRSRSAPESLAHLHYDNLQHAGALTPLQLQSGASAEAGTQMHFSGIHCDKDLHAVLAFVDAAHSDVWLTATQHNLSSKAEQIIWQLFGRVCAFCFFFEVAAIGKLVQCMRSH